MDGEFTGAKDDRNEFGNNCHPALGVGEPVGSDEPSEHGATSTASSGAIHSK